MRKLSRVLRAHFHRIRAAIIGPDLSTRRLLADAVLARPGEGGHRRTGAPRQVLAARRVEEGAPLHLGNRRGLFAPGGALGQFLLTPVWNRIYRGVLVHHLEGLKEAAPGHEIIYVPSHRSHMDYLLVSYLLYTKGIVPPHIVAGINLNLPVIGSLLLPRRRRVLHPPLDPRQRAVFGGIERIRRAAGVRRLFHRMLHRGAGARAPAACCRPRAG